MFKINLTCRSRNKGLLRQYLHVLAASLLLPTLGCRLIPPLPPVNLNEPGWSVKHGQAVWKFKKDAPEIAGELLVASRGANQSYVQFTKGPFPMATGQISPAGWQIERGDSRARYSGPGRPPTRIIILQLPALLAGAPPPHGYLWQLNDKNWRLENKKTGEFLEGFVE